MKKLLIISTIFLYSCSGYISVKESNKLIEQAKQSGYKNGRFDEKIRWMDYHNDSISAKIITIQIKALAGEISPAEAFKQASKVAMDGSEPFYNQ